MDTEDLNDLYLALLDLLQRYAPWAAEQVEQSVREGRPVAKQVRRGKGGAETIAEVLAPAKLREDQFLGTQDLTPGERALVALNSVERLLVDPARIDRAMRQTMALAKVEDVLFSEPSVEASPAIEPVRLTFAPRDQLAHLLARVKQELAGVR